MSLLHPFGCGSRWTPEFAVPSITSTASISMSLVLLHTKTDTPNLFRAFSEVLYPNTNSHYLNQRSISFFACDQIINISGIHSFGRIVFCAFESKCLKGLCFLSFGALHKELRGSFDQQSYLTEDTVVLKGYGLI